MRRYLEDLYDSLNQYFPNRQCLMLYPCVKDPFKEQDRPSDFNGKEEEKYTDGVPASTWRRITEEAQLGKCGCGIKGKCPQSSEKALSITALVFNCKSVWRRFSSYILIKAYLNRLTTAFVPCWVNSWLDSPLLTHPVFPQDTLLLFAEKALWIPHSALSLDYLIMGNSLL